MPYSPIIPLKLARAEAVVLRDFISDVTLVAGVRAKNPALAIVLEDIAAQLERELVEHCRTDYAAVLAKMKEEVCELEAIGIPKDILLRVRRDFAKKDQVEAIRRMRALKSDRLMRCAVHMSKGSIDSLARAVATGLEEDRDLMFAAEYDRFQERLFDFNRPFEEAAVHK